MITLTGKDLDKIQEKKVEKPKHPGEIHFKIGLALSGGGFRASFFHLGVIKRLEELGLMEKVDKVSTVSGGSIF